MFANIILKTVSWEEYLEVSKTDIYGIPAVICVKDGDVYVWPFVKSQADIPREPPEPPKPH